MRKYIIISGLSIFFFIFGSLGMIKIREQIVEPLQDVVYLNSPKAIEDILANKNKKYSFNPSQPIVWNSKVLNIEPNFLAEIPSDQQVLGDTSGNWIEVTLSTQTLCFHETSGNTPCFPISSGLQWTPTPTGNFHVWTKLPVTTMVGPGYNLPNIHWTMYFYGGYSTHEAYWHNNFGHPMSHGCVNMRINDAKYIYDRSEVGTLVNIHD
jgi:hypothetical protein